MIEFLEVFGSIGAFLILWIGIGLLIVYRDFAEQCAEGMRLAQQAFPNEVLTLRANFWFNEIVIEVGSVG